MRIPCPICGPRDRREFYYKGDACLSRRPEGGDPRVWSDWLNGRDNPAGLLRELWYHEGGCGVWLEVTRDTRTHEMLGAKLVEASHAD